MFNEMEKACIFSAVEIMRSQCDPSWNEHIDSIQKKIDGEVKETSTPPEDWTYEGSSI